MRGVWNFGLGKLLNSQGSMMCGGNLGDVVGRATDNRGPDCEASEEVWGHSYDILI